MTFSNADRTTSSWNIAVPERYREQCWMGTDGPMQVSFSALSVATAQWGGVLGLP